MKILVLGRQYIAKSEEIIKGFQDLGHTVHYCLFPSLQYPQAYYATHTEQIDSPIYKSKLTYYWGHYNQVKKILLNSKQFNTNYDYILAIDWLEASIANSLKRHYPKSKIIYYAYDYYFYNSIFSSRYLINRIEKLAYMRADIVWAVNQQIIQEHQNKNLNRVQVFTVPLGIKSKTLPNYNPNPKQFLFIGNFKEGHNLRLLVKTFAKLPVDYHLHLIGQGNLYPEIQQLKIDLQADNITLYGFQTEQETIDIISKNQISYGLALYENTQEILCADPGKIKDYLSSGLPIITTPYPSISKDIQEYNLGLAIQDNAESLYETLLHIDENDMNAFKNSIRQYTQQHSYAKILAKALSQSK
jgi:glycosyltransferase involved in cell wall biosynthesis